MKKSYFFLSFLLISQLSFAQYFSGVSLPDTSTQVNIDSNDISFTISKSIQVKDLERHLSILASDVFEGRETGEKGNEKAIDYISQHFKNIGLPAIGLENSYKQEIAFTWTSWENIKLQIDSTDYIHLKDFVSLPTENNSLLNFLSEEVIFLGFGIDDPAYSDYKGNDLKDKVILIYQGEPIKKDSTYWISGTKQRSDWSANLDLKLKTANEHGVKLVLIIESNIQSRLFSVRRKLISPVMEIGDKTSEELDVTNSIFINTNMAKAIIGANLKKISKSRDRSHKKGKACEVKLNQRLFINQVKNMRLLKSANVAGYIEGGDKKDELIVLSAHFDHLGIRGEDNIYNGANDNASGTTAVMEIAEAFALAKAQGNGPRRSILCLLVTGEEKGLLGSEYYTQKPLFPLENTMANINIDMIGRTDTHHEDKDEYVYVIGSDRISRGLHQINQDANNLYTRMTLDYTYNSENDPNRYYYRSDHYNFAQKGIPSIFFFNGNHEDYHRVTDTVDKIQFDKLEKTTRMIFHTCWLLANREKSLVRDRLQ